ncbi:MAG: WXG100 family type VII secretion target [Clostridiales bacterium]|nr:WXG100 family type VII secretion target [Clostridiales bacterium]
MAASYFEVDTALLRSDTDGISDNINAASSQLTGLFEEIQTLNTMWQGAANSAFNTQFNKDYETMGEILSEAAKYAQALENAGEKYESCENSVEAAVRAMNI